MLFQRNVARTFQKHTHKKNHKNSSYKCVIFLLCSVNGNAFEEDKTLQMASHGSHDLEDEEAEELAADEYGEEPSDTPHKSREEMPNSDISDDIIEDGMDFSRTNDSSQNCKISPMR